MRVIKTVAPRQAVFQRCVQAADFARKTFRQARLFAQWVQNRVVHSQLTESTLLLFAFVAHWSHLFARAHEEMREKQIYVDRKHKIGGRLGISNSGTVIQCGNRDNTTRDIGPYEGQKEERVHGEKQKPSTSITLTTHRR